MSRARTEADELGVFVLDEARRGVMRGRSWRDDPRCPPFDALRLVRVRHRTFDGEACVGELVVAASIADATQAIFQALFEMKFPIRRIEPIDAFEGDDDASMAADNSSAFNFRAIAGGTTLSHHALGVAIDVNPAENPMILGGAVHPGCASAYVDRERNRPGMILEGGPVVALFAAHGFEWGGSWPDLRDYHHFSRLPRGATRVTE